MCPAGQSEPTHPFDGCDLGKGTNVTKCALGLIKYKSRQVSNGKCRLAAASSFHRTSSAFFNIIATARKDTANFVSQPIFHLSSPVTFSFRICRITAEKEI
jgi:hypothetical protein